MTFESAFGQAVARHVESLRSVGFDTLRRRHGNGFVAVVAFRQDEFVNIVLDTHDDEVYAEVGHTTSGRLPGWGGPDRIDLRQLPGVPRNLGQLNLEERAIEPALAQVLEFLLRTGIPYLERQRK